MKEFGVMHECVGCKNAMIDVGGQCHTDAHRQRMVSVAMSNSPKHTERLESCSAKRTAIVGRMRKCLYRFL